MYAIIQWSDKGSGLLNLANVTGLKRVNVEEYKDGDYIYAMYGKHKYRARISEKNEDKSYLQSLEKDKTFPVEYEYDSEEAEVYEDTFIEGGVNKGQNATAAVSKPVGVKELKITTIKKKTCTSDALQQEAQKLLTERLLSKPRRTSPRKRPATMTYNPFDEEHLDSYIAKSAAKRKQNIINDDSSEMQPPDVKPSTINQSGKQNEEYVTRKEYKDLHRKYKTLKERITILEGKFATPKPTAKHVAEEDTEVESLSKPTTSIATGHLFNGKTYNELQESVCHSDSLFACVHYLLLHLFTIEYILSHSVSGQASNSKCVAKPKFDARLYDTLVSIALKQYPKATKCEVTKRVQAVQKKYLLKEKKIEK